MSADGVSGLVTAYDSVCAENIRLRRDLGRTERQLRALQNMLYEAIRKAMETK